MPAWTRGLLGIAGVKLLLRRFCVCFLTTSCVCTVCVDVLTRWCPSRNMPRHKRTWPELRDRRRLNIRVANTISRSSVCDALIGEICLGWITCERCFALKWWCTCVSSHICAYLKWLMEAVTFSYKLQIVWASFTQKANKQDYWNFSCWGIWLNLIGRSLLVIHFAGLKPPPPQILCPHPPL